MKVGRADHSPMKPEGSELVNLRVITEPCLESLAGGMLKELAVGSRKERMIACWKAGDQACVTCCAEEEPFMQGTTLKVIQVSCRRNRAFKRGVIFPLIHEAFLGFPGPDDLLFFLFIYPEYFRALSASCHMLPFKASRQRLAIVQSNPNKLTPWLRGQVV